MKAALVLPAPKVCLLPMRAIRFSLPFLSGCVGVNQSWAATKMTRLQPPQSPERPKVSCKLALFDPLPGGLSLSNLVAAPILMATMCWCYRSAGQPCYNSTAVPNMTIELVKASCHVPKVAAGGPFRLYTQASS